MSPAPDLLLLTYAHRAAPLRSNRAGYRTLSHAGPRAWQGIGHQRHRLTLCGKKWYEVSEMIDGDGRALPLGEQVPGCKGCRAALAKLRQAPSERPDNPRSLGRVAGRSAARWIALGYEPAAAYYLPEWGSDEIAEFRAGYAEGLGERGAERDRQGLMAALERGAG